MLNITINNEFSNFAGGVIVGLMFILDANQDEGLQAHISVDGLQVDGRIRDKRIGDEVVIL